MRKALLAMVFGLLLPVAAQAAPSMCRFGGFDDKATTVDIAALYKAADVVVTGKVVGRYNDGSDLKFQVASTVKGSPAKEIILHGQQRINTEMNGFVLPGEKEVLVFLKAGSGGVYEGVEDYNSACNITYFIKDGKVTLIEHDPFNPGQEVAVDKIKDFLDSNPPKLSYNYK